MSNDPWDSLKNIKIPPMTAGSKTPDPVAQASVIGQEISGTVKTGLNFGRWVNAKITKNQLKQAGYDPITIEAVEAAIKAGTGYEGILAAAEEAKQARLKADELRKNPPSVHGSARFATAQEAQEAGFQKEKIPATGAGLYLGEMAGKPLYWQGESHLLTVAPTRTGKGTMQILPNLLRYKGSAVVLDPKGELAAQTARWREENVGPVYILNPFGQAPFGVHTQAFNPLDGVKNAQDATKMAEMIYPRVQDDKQRFFENEAIGFLAGIIEFFACYAPENKRNLGSIRDATTTLDEEFEALLKALSNPRYPPSIRNAAKNMATKSYDVGQLRVLDSLNQHLRVWDSEGLRAATARSDFQFQDLKDTPATVYLVLPFDELSTYSTYVQMMFANALEAMLQNPNQPEIPVLFVLDEFLALEADDRFVSALRTHASAGVRLWFFLQDLPTLEQKYAVTWKSFLQAEVKTFFGTDDPYTAKLVSEYLGDTTVAFDMPAANPSVSGSAASYSIAENVQLTGRPLLKPEEVTRLLTQVDASIPRQALHFIRGIPPVQATLTPWFSDPDILDREEEPHETRP